MGSVANRKMRVLSKGSDVKHKDDGLSVKRNPIPRLLQCERW